MKKIALLLLLMACSDTSTSGMSLDAESTRSITPDISSQDVRVISIPDITVDAWVDPCANLPNTHVRYWRPFENFFAPLKVQL